MVNVQIFWFDDKELPISEVATEISLKSPALPIFGKAGESVTENR